MVATPIRRRVAAALTCIALAVGTFGYMERSASEAASEAPRVPPAEACDETATPKPDCLRLFGE
jgi:hypothetical protein